MRIDEYLTELESVVPRRHRRRFLEEAESHLRDAASRYEHRGLTPDAAEEAAVRDFGAPRVVAARLVADGARRELRAATAVIAVLAMLFVVPLYGIPENTLPPATWTHKPTDILVLQVVTVALWVAAVVFGCTAAVLAWTPWPRASARIATASVLAIALSCGVSTVLVGRWFEVAPATPSWPLLAAPFGLACLGMCGAAAVRVRRRARTLETSPTPSLGPSA